MADATAETVRLIGGDPAIDFVNTVGGRVADARASATPAVRDKLRDYSDLLAWARHAGLLSDALARRLARAASERPAEAARVFRRAVETREASYRILRSLMARRRPDAGDLELLNHELAATRSRERLVAGAQGLRWDAPGAEDRLDAALEPICRATSALLTSGELSQLRQCAGDDCGWLFLDHSRNHSRQWCTMEDCGNLSKVRRFRQRQRREGRATGSRP